MKAAFEFDSDSPARLMVRIKPETPEEVLLLDTLAHHRNFPLSMDDYLIDHDGEPSESHIILRIRKSASK